VAGFSNGTSHGRVPGKPGKPTQTDAERELENEADRIVQAIRLGLIRPQEAVRRIVQLVEERSRQQEREP
jgi:hypothetical protein